MKKMSTIFQEYPPSTRAVLKLLRDIDENVKTIADLKSGNLLLKLLTDLKVINPKNCHNTKNPFQIIRKSLKKSLEKDILQKVNFDYCEQGYESELLYLSSILLHRFYQQHKENENSNFSYILTSEETAALNSMWNEMDSLPSSTTTFRRDEKFDVLKEFNYSSRRTSNSPVKHRTLETPGNHKKELRQKDVCITNLRTHVEDYQQLLSDCYKSQQESAEKISRLETTVKEQRSKLARLENAQEAFVEHEALQITIDNFKTENEKLLHKVTVLKDATKEMPKVEIENKELHAANANLFAKNSSLEQRNKQLHDSLKKSEQRQWETESLSQQVNILKEELQVKEEAINELNNMISIYQDKLVHKEDAVNLNSSDEGEVIAAVCSPFRNTPNELIALQSHIHSLQDEKAKLEADLNESSTQLFKSFECNKTLENQVNNLQQLLENLNLELASNQQYSEKLDSQLITKDNLIKELGEQMEKFETEISNLCCTVKVKSEREALLEHEYSISVKLSDALRKELEERNKTVSCLEDEKKALNEARTGLLIHVSKLEETGNQLLEEINTRSVHIENISSKLEDLERNLAHLRTDNIEKINRLQSLEKDKTESEVESVKLKENFQKLERKLNDKIVEMDSLLSELMELRQSYSKLKTEEEGVRGELNTFLVKSEQLETKLNDTMVEKDSLLSELTELRQSYSKLKTEEEGVRGELNSSLVKSEQLEMELFKVKEDKTTLFNEKIKTEQLVDSLELCKRENEKICFQLRENISVLKADYEQVNAELSVLKSLIVEVTEAKEQLSKESHSISIQLAASANEVASLLLAKSELLGQISYLQAENKTLTIQLESSLFKNVTDAQEIQGLQDKLESTENVMKELDQKLHVTNENIRALTDEMLAAKEKITELKENLTQSQIKASMLQEKVQLSNQDNDIFCCRLKTFDQLITPELTATDLAENLQLDDKLNLMIDDLRKTKIQKTECLLQIANVASENVRLNDHLKRLENSLCSNLNRLCALEKSKRITLNISPDRQAVRFSKIESSPVSEDEDCNAVKTLEELLSMLEENNKEKLRQKDDILDTLLKEKASLVKEIENLEGCSKTQSDNIVSLELENQALQQTLHNSLIAWESEKKSLLLDSKTHQDELSKSILSLEHDFHDIFIEREALVVKVTEYEQELKSFQNDLGVTLAEKSKVIDALCEKEENLTLLEENLEELKLLQEEMCASADERAEMIKNLNLEIKATSGRCEELISELVKKENLLSKSSELKHQVESLKSELLKLKDVYSRELLLLKENMKKDIEFMAQQMEKKSFALVELESQFQHILEANNCLVAETMKNAKEIISLQNELRSVNTGNDELKETIRKQTTQAEDFVNQQAEFEQTISSLEKSLAIAKQQAEEMKKIVAENDITLENVTQKLNSLMKAEDKTRNILNDKSKETEKLDATINLQLQQIENLKSQVETLETEVSKIRISQVCESHGLDEIDNPSLKNVDDINLLQNQLKGVNTENDELKKTIRKQTTEVEDFVNQRAGFKQTISSLEAALAIAQKRTDKTFAESNSMLENVTQKTNSLLETEDMTRNNLNDERKEIEKLEETVSLQLRQIEELTSQVETLKDEISKLRMSGISEIHGLDEINNPSLKQWMEQFSSLCKKLQEMREKHFEGNVSEDANVLTDVEFENNTLGMIREHILSWFTRSNFIIDDLRTEVDNVSQENNTNRHTLVNVTEKVEMLEQALCGQSVACQSELYNSPEVTLKSCTRCLTEYENIKLLDKKLEEKSFQLNSITEKYDALLNKYQSKEKQVELLKESITLNKQVLFDQKYQHERESVQYERQQVSLNNQIISLNAQLEASRSAFENNEKKLFMEVQDVYKRLQEKTNLSSTTSKSLSQTKLQLLNVTKKYTELLDKYNWRKEQIESISASLKKQKSENDTLTNENRRLAFQIQSQQKKQFLNSTAFGSGASMVSDMSFMQDSFSSAGNVSLDSAGFVKPAVPSHRFACDEEEGHFLDQSRNLSDLQEGRCDRLKEMQRRNTLCKPHLRSQYPVETQAMLDTSTVCVNDITHTPHASKKFAAPTTLTNTSTRVQNMPPVQRKRSSSLAQAPTEVVRPPAKKMSVADHNVSTSSSVKHQWRPSFTKVFSPFKKNPTRKDKHKDPNL